MKRIIEAIMRRLGIRPAMVPTCRYCGERTWKWSVNHGCQSKVTHA